MSGFYRFPSCARYSRRRHFDGCGPQSPSPRKFGRAHHQELSLPGHQHHVPADRSSKGAFGQKLFGEILKARDLVVVPVGESVERQKALVDIETEMTAVVVGEIPCVVAVADDKKL